MSKIAKLLLALMAVAALAVVYITTPIAQNIDTVTVRVKNPTGQRIMIGLVTSHALTYDRVSGFMDADNNGSVTFYYVPAGRTDVYVLPSNCEGRSPYYSKESEKIGFPILAQFQTTRDYRWRRTKSLEVTVDVASCTSTVTAKVDYSWRVIP